MRYREVVAEQAEQPWVKVWLNAITGKAIEFDIYESHEHELRADPQKYGLEPQDVIEGHETDAMNKALHNRWIRIANFNDAALVGVATNEENGYVNAASVRDARYGTAWLKQHGYLPPVLSIEIGYGGPHIALDGVRIERFLRGEWNRLRERFSPKSKPKAPRLVLRHGRDQLA